MEFTKTAPKWEAAGIAPPDELLKEGFKAGYKPPAPYFNNLFHNYSAAIGEIQQNLSNVDNTPDANKPVSVDQKAAIDAMLISGAAAGSMVSVVDSAAAPFNALKVHGASKQQTTTGVQLIQYPYHDGVLTASGVTFTPKNDGGVNVVGTATANAYFTMCGGFADAKANIPEWLPEGGEFTISGGTSDLGVALYLYSSDGKTVSFIAFGSATTFTIPSGYNYYGLFVQVPSGKSVNATVYPMLNNGANAKNYEPYTGGVAAPNPDYPQVINSVGDNGSVKVTSCGKNILKPLSKTQTFNGVTFTPNSDGTITVNGTATSSAALVLEYRRAIVGKYILSGSTTNTRLVARVVYNDGSNRYHTSYNGSVVEFEITEDVREYNVYVEVKGDIAVNSEIMRPMLRTVGNATYEPYTELTAAVPLSLPLYGIPVTSGGNYTDENGQQWICDEIDTARGVYIQRIKKMVLDGSEAWVKNDEGASDKYLYFLRMLDIGRDVLLCDKLQQKATNTLNTSGKTEDTEGIYVSRNYAVIYLNINMHMSENTASGFKSALSNNPITVIYPLAESIETPLTQEQLTALYSLRSYEGITNVFTNDIGGLSVDYFKNTANGKAISTLQTNLQEIKLLLGEMNGLLEEINGGT